MDYIFHILNIIIFVAIIYFASRSKVRAYFSNQRADLEQTMSKAAEDLDRIQSEYNEIKEKVANLDAIMTEIREEAGYALDRELRKIRENTSTYLDKLQKDTDRKMTQNLDKARHQIEEELIEIAVAAARRKLESKLSSNKNLDQEWTEAMVNSAAAHSVGEKNYAS